MRRMLRFFRCKREVRAVYFDGTAEVREEIGTWMGNMQDTVKVTFDDEDLEPGDWVLISDGEFIVMGAEAFRDAYEEVRIDAGGKP